MTETVILAEQVDTMRGAIEAVYAMLRQATTEYYQASDMLTNATAALDKAKALGLANETITGRNPEMREASAREQLPKFYEAVEMATALERTKRLNLELARIDVERQRALLRVMELPVGVSQDQ